MDASYRTALTRALAHALDYLAALDRAPVGATTGLDELRARLGRPLAEEGCEAARVVDDLVADTTGGIIGSAGGRFFGWVIGGAVPAALACDWLTATWDQNAASYACGPAEAVIEETVAGWLTELLGLPATASVAFTSGSQMAHLTCLAAARHFLLSRLDWDVERKGLAGAPRLRLLTSSEYHGSVDRAVRFLGLGLDAIETLSVDDEGWLRPAALDAALATGEAAPTIVLLQAGDLNIGAFDPFAELVPIARRYGAWVHVDGAFGLWAAASPVYRHLLAGVEAADSWVTDGHKWLNVPYDSGYAIVNHRDAHKAAMTYHASYLQRSEAVREPKDWNPEWSRRGRGVATYAALRQLGRAGIAAMIERCCRHAANLANGIGELPGAELLWAPRLNQGLVRFRDPRPGATASDHDRQTDRVIANVAAAGEAFFTGTTWRGVRAMRVSVCNWQTNESDVARSIAAVRAVLEQSARAA
jgi:glutamate/tyrosine decarboxylase-like PLP-dependent enzyme